MLNHTRLRPLNAAHRADTVLLMTTFHTSLVNAPAATIASSLMGRVTGFARPSRRQAQNTGPAIGSQRSIIG